MSRPRSKTAGRTRADGRKPLLVYLRPDVIKRLKMAALDEDRTAYELTEEAVSRYRTDRGYADAATLIADFQSEVASRVEAGHIDRHMLALVGGALHQSKIPTSPELAAVSAGQDVDDGAGGSFPADFRATLAGLLEACGGDPFALVGSFAEFGHAMPAETRSALAAGL